VEPSTMLSILLSLICLALLVYLPKLRNTVLWILFPPVMMLVRYPKTRKPAAAIGVALVLTGVGFYARSEYKRRHDWYCDRGRTKDGSEVMGRSSPVTLACYLGEDACRKSHENDGKHSEFDDIPEMFDWGFNCSFAYSEMWTYDFEWTLVADRPHREEKVHSSEQFAALEDCKRARSANLKAATSECEDARKRLDRILWTAAHR
jgi:hypothetical protein